MKPFTTLITALIGVFTAVIRPSKMPPTAFTRPEKALEKFRVNTPVTKSRMPWRMGFREPFHRFLMVLNAFSTTGAITVLNTNLKAGASTFWMKFPMACSAGWRLFCQMFWMSVNACRTNSLMAGIFRRNRSLTRFTFWTIRFQTGWPTVFQMVWMTAMACWNRFLTVSMTPPKVMPEFDRRPVRSETQPETVEIAPVTSGITKEPRFVSSGVRLTRTSETRTLPAVTKGSTAAPMPAMALFSLSWASLAAMTSPFTSRYLSAASV